VANNNIKKKMKFTIFAFITIVITIFFANYVSQLLFNGKNSLEVYNVLKIKKVDLENDIKTLQLDNAKLQKGYFELKNLEPEE
jgi:cell division protein FtsB